MDEGDMEKLFQSVAQHSDQDHSDVRQIFSILVRATLQFRDEMLSSKGIVVTVGDVRTSLDWLTSTLATGTMPDMDNKISLDLLKRWIQDIKLSGSQSVE